MNSCQRWLLCRTRRHQQHHQGTVAIAIHCTTKTLVTCKTKRNIFTRESSYCFQRVL